MIAIRLVGTSTYIDYYYYKLIVCVLSRLFRWLTQWLHTSIPAVETTDHVIFFSWEERGGGSRNRSNGRRGALMETHIFGGQGETKLVGVTPRWLIQFWWQPPEYCLWHVRDRKLNETDFHEKVSTYRAPTDAGNISCKYLTGRYN